MSQPMTPPAKARPGGRIGHRAVWIVGGAALAVAVFYLVQPRGPAPHAEFPFPCLPQETLALHVHPYLRIVIDGAPVTIPAAIGIRDPQFQQGIAVGGSCFEPLHTHDSSGILHIEAPDPNAQYALGDFFAVWRATYPTIRIGGTAFPVTFTATELLGHTATAAHRIRLLVDGKQAELSPSLELNRLDYCSAQSIGPPCFPTAVGDPFPPEILRKYGTGHTIVLEYQ
jgi:hypothetical protein